MQIKLFTTLHMSKIRVHRKTYENIHGLYQKHINTLLYSNTQKQHTIAGEL